MFKQDLLLLIDPKLLLCIFDKGLICETEPAIQQRNTKQNLKLLPSYNFNISRKFDTFYNCTAVKCNQMYLNSIRQVTDPELVLIGCYKSNDCVRLKYYDMKTVNKLKFLNNNVKHKIFYTLDCLTNQEGSGICFKKDQVNTLIFKDTTANVMLDETYIPSPDAFICEQSRKKKGKRFVCACGALAALDGYSPQQDPDQFHIQTDEDDERYFLYQTHNGQYRKERRLKDGSVIGTTGWVGADGYLRLQDYIADQDGYRIYKSKTVFVGQNRPIGESLKIAKTAPTDSGFGVTPAPAVQQARGTRPVSSTTPTPVSSTRRPPTSFPAEVSVTPPPRVYSSPTPTPQVHVSPNSIDLSTKFNFKPTVPPITASEASPSPSPYDYDSSNTNTIDDGYYASDSTRLDVFNPNSYRHADEWLRRQRPGVRLGDGYTPQFPQYDGVAFRQNGFRYYLPKQYHEEDSSNSNERTGSFGYIDPFGIRRVIYYNTAPGEGFQVRKNNRYVGHDATPYDPRPIN